MKDITSTITKPLAVLGENRRHDFRCQRNARRECKAYAGGACKGSDCKRSNGFAGSGGRLIDFTHSYALWRFFKKHLKTTGQKGSQQHRNAPCSAVPLTRLSATASSLFPPAATSSTTHDL